MSTITKSATAAQAAKARKAIDATMHVGCRELDWYDGRQLIALDLGDAIEISQLAMEGKISLPKDVWLEPVNDCVLSVWREVPAR